jgi:hypothetical protein
MRTDEASAYCGTASGSDSRGRLHPRIRKLGNNIVLRVFDNVPYSGY